MFPRKVKGFVIAVSLLVGTYLSLSMDIIYIGFGKRPAQMQQDMAEEEMLSTSTTAVYKQTPEKQVYSKALNKTYPCLDPNAVQNKRVEDMFCMSPRKFEPKFKNPCYYTNNHRLRCLPHFYILGSEKSGTTDLYSRMMKHPQIEGNLGVIKKETYYWGWKRYGKLLEKPCRKNQTLSEYVSMFDSLTNQVQNPGKSNLVIGDATPVDFHDFRYWKSIPQNAGKVSPEVLTPHLMNHLYGDRRPKLILLLREPVQRLFSYYAFHNLGPGPEAFHQDMVTSLKLLNQCMEKSSKRLCLFNETLYTIMPARLLTSCYSVFLREWLEVFPRSSFFISTLEHTSANKEEILRDIFNFLELESLPEDTMSNIVRIKPIHVTKRKVGKKVLPETFALLKDFITECNKDLAALLNDDRFLWKNSS